MREHHKPLERRICLVGDPDNAEEEKQTLVSSSPVDDQNPEEKIDDQKSSERSIALTFLYAFRKTSHEVMQ